MTTPELQHNISVAFDTARVAWEPLRISGIPTGLEARALRRLEDGTLRSAIIRIPAGWSSEAALRLRGGQQCFVLTGDILLDGKSLGPNAFFAGSSGSVMAELSSQAGAELIAIYDHFLGYEAQPPSTKSRDIQVVVNGFDVAPITPEINGTKLVGFERRVLWEDQVSGADTRLLRIPGGFEGRGPNWHPVHEEIYHLAGAGGPDDTRKLDKGWYLWNPAFGVHGYHEHSAHGMTLLEWHDGKWAMNLYHPEASA